MRTGGRQKLVGDGMGTGPTAEAGPSTAAEDKGLGLEACAWEVPVAADVKAVMGASSHQTARLRP